MAQKEVENNKNFVEKVNGSHEISPDKTTSPVQSSIKNTVLQQTDANTLNDSHEKVDCNHERSPDETGLQVPSSRDNLQQTDGEKKYPMD